MISIPAAGIDISEICQAASRNSLELPAKLLWHNARMLACCSCTWVTDSVANEHAWPPFIHSFYML